MSIALLPVALGLALALAVLLVCFGSVRATLTLAASVGAALLIGGLVPIALGSSLIPATLLGLAVALGGLIDDGVTVQENILRHRDLGADRRTAARRGTAEVGRGLVGSAVGAAAMVLTLGLAGGIAGRWLAPVGIAAGTALLVSALVAATLPWTAALPSDPPDGRRWRARTPGALVAWIDRVADRYHDGLAWSLDRPRVTVLVIVGSFGLAAIGAGAVARLDPPGAADVARPIRLEIRGPDASTLMGVAQRTIDEIDRVEGTRDVGLSSGGMALDRLGGERLVEIDVGASGRPVREIVGSIERRLATVPPPPGYRITLAGPVAEQREGIRRGAMALVAGLVLTGLLLYRQLGSAREPVAIVLGLPLAILGSFVTIRSGSAPPIGAAVLFTATLTIKQSVILSSLVNRRVARGVGLRVGLIEAGRLRLRPVLLTTLALGAALTPIAMMPGPLAGFARAAIAGTITSTLAVTLAIPAIHEALALGRDPLGHPLTRRRPLGSEPEMPEGA